MSAFWSFYLFSVSMMSCVGAYFYFTFGVLAASAYQDKNTRKQVSKFFKTVGVGMALITAIAPLVFKYIIGGVS